MTTIENAPATTTFAELVKGLPDGAMLRTVHSEHGLQHGIWTGSFALKPSAWGDQHEEVGIVWNVSSSEFAMPVLNKETEWSLEPQVDGEHAMADPETRELAKALGMHKKSSMMLRRRTDEAESALRKFKSEAHSVLSDWAEENIDDSSSQWESFSDTLESIGLDGLKRKYEVRVSVTYSLTVEVEAASEDAAGEEVDNNLSDYLNDIDLDYYEDYSIESVDRA